MINEQLLREALHDIEQAHDLSLDFEHYASRQVLVSIADKIKTAIAQPAEGGEVCNVKSSAGLIRPGKVDAWVANHYTTPPASQEQAQQPSFEMPDLEASYKAADALYEIGYRHSGRHDFDPRGNAEWQRVVDMISASHAQQPKCKCGDRLASQCDEEWGPKCDLGNNEKFVRVAQQPATGEPVAPYTVIKDTSDSPLSKRISKLIEMVFHYGKQNLSGVDDEISAISREIAKLESRVNRPAPSVPDGWVLMPRELTPDEAMKGQGALLDMCWDATTCFVARYAELIRATEPRRAAMLAAK